MSIGSTNSLQRQCAGPPALPSVREEAVSMVAHVPFHRLASFSHGLSRRRRLRVLSISLVRAIAPPLPLAGSRVCVCR